MKTVDFSETIAASDLKVSRSRHLIEYMKICENSKFAIKDHPMLNFKGV